MVKIKSPYFLADVKFNSNGLHHLSYSNNRGSRKIEEKVLKFKSLSYAYDIIAKSSTIQEYREVKVADNIIKYYSMIAIDKELKRKTRVIIRKVGNGDLHFWSVMPYSRIKNGMQKLHLADIEDI